MPKISLDRIPQRFVALCVVRRERNSWWMFRLSGLLPRSISTLPSKVFAQDRVLQLHLQFLALRMRILKGFFALFSEGKVWSTGEVVSAQLGGDVSSSTLSARQMAWTVSPEDSDDYDADRWVDECGRIGCIAVASEVVVARHRQTPSRRSCAADGRAAGGRPPFLRYAFACCRAGISTCPRSSSRTDWRTEAEVPTIFCFLKWTVDISVPCGGKHRPEGFLPGQGFQPSLEPIAEIPVAGGGLQDFLPDQGSAGGSPEGKSAKVTGPAHQS